MPAKSAAAQGAEGQGDMYNFQAPLFWFKFVFLAEILVAEALIVYRMKRRHGFAWRLALTLALLLGFTFALPVPFYNAIYSSALFMAIFLATLPALKLCFDESWGNIVFCGFFSYTEQHISYQLYNFFCIVAGLDASSNLYGDSFVGDLNGLQVLAFAVTHVLVYLAGWAVLKFPESDRRVVRLNVWRKANMISVHMENEVAEGESVRFENGLPVTNSPERNLHGFGMRSIRASVERYNGCVLAEMRDGSFCIFRHHRRGHRNARRARKQDGPSCAERRARR